MINIRELLPEVSKPKPESEENFWDKHVKGAVKYNHPVAPESQFKGLTKKDHTKKASFKNGEDEAVYEQVASDGFVEDLDEDFTPELLEHSASFHDMAKQHHQDRMMYHVASAGALQTPNAMHELHKDAGIAHLVASIAHDNAIRVHRDPKWHAKQKHGTPKKATNHAHELSSKASAASSAASNYRSVEEEFEWTGGAYGDIVEDFFPHG